jgi:hypothetical protein
MLKRAGFALLFGALLALGVRVLLEYISAAAFFLLHFL